MALIEVEAVAVDFKLDGTAKAMATHGFLHQFTQLNGWAHQTERLFAISR